MTNLEYIAEVTIEDLFEAAAYGVEYGVGKRKVIGKNEGIFDKQFVVDIVKSVMDDRDIFNEVGLSGFREVLEDIEGLCTEYLNIIEDDSRVIKYWEEKNLDLYENVLDSLDEICDYYE